MKKNLLEGIEELSVLTIKSTMNNILEALHDRELFYELREPESCGSVYDEWEEMYNEFEEIIKVAEELIKAEIDSEFLEAQIEEFKKMVEDFQIIHGGLSRLKIDVG